MAGREKKNWSLAVQGRLGLYRQKRTPIPRTRTFGTTVTDIQLDTGTAMAAFNMKMSVVLGQSKLCLPAVIADDHLRTSACRLLVQHGRSSLDGI